jgi:purine-binding chemotaxis protein CheW
MVQTPLLAPPPSAAADAPPERRACLFSVAGFRFAVDVRSAREVVLFDDITSVPRAPRSLVGVANLRGTVMPIVDVRALLGLPETVAPRSARTLVVRDGALQAAMVVDAVLGLEPYDDVVPIDSPAVAPLVGPRPLMAGWIHRAGETLALVDVPRLLAAIRASLPTMAQEVSA